MAKQRSKGVRKNRSARQQVIPYLVGARMAWSDFDPLSKDSEIINHRLSHKYALGMRNLHKLKPHTETMTSRMDLKWRVTISVEFKDLLDKQYWREAELVASGKLFEADPDFDRAIEDIFAQANMSQYVCCHFRAEIIGSNTQIKDGDFTG